MTESNEKKVVTIGEYAKKMREGQIKRSDSSKFGGKRGDGKSGGRHGRGDDSRGGYGSRRDSERYGERGDRPARPYGDRPQGDRPRGDRPYGDRPRGDRPARPYGDRPQGDRPRGDRPYGDRPRGDRPARPYGDRPQRFETKIDGKSDKPRLSPEEWVAIDAVEGIRISKKIADLGYCARRAAEELVTTGKVKINDVVITDLAHRVKKEDTIHIEDKLLPNVELPTKVYLFHKPVGCLTTNKDPQGRKTIFDIIPEKLGRLVTVGRLDFNSEGLLVLTNKGEFARMMELPSTNIQRRYRVLVTGNVDKEQLEGLKEGITIDDFHYRGMSVRIESDSEDIDIANGKISDIVLEEITGEETENVEIAQEVTQTKMEGETTSPIQDNQETSPETDDETSNSSTDENANPETEAKPSKKTWLSIYIKEGKNREIRKVMAHCGLTVIRLIRVGYGKYSLSGIPVGCVMEYKGKI